MIIIADTERMREVVMVSAKCSVNCLTEGEMGPKKAAEQMSETAQRSGLMLCFSFLPLCPFSFVFFTLL